MRQESLKFTPDPAFEWAREIVAQTFELALRHNFDKNRVRKSRTRWLLEKDPIYQPLLSGLSPREQEMLIGNWLLVQTLTVSCRFAMEEAIRQIIWRHREVFGREVAAIYTGWDLEREKHLQFPRFAFMGEERKEWSIRRGWNVKLKASALDVINQMVDEEDARLDEALADANDRPGEALRAGFPTSDLVDAARERIVQALATTSPARKLRLSCNLIVVHPPPARIKAFRFINRRNAGRATVREARVNQLRLFAYIQQEKIFRRPESCDIVLAPLYERERSSWHFELRFGTEEIWTDADFWKYVGVPYPEVYAGLEIAGKRVAERLAEGMK